MIQEQMISKILKTKDTSLIIMERLDESFFSNYRSEWRYLCAHLNKYGCIPDIESFLSNFPDFDYIDVQEPTSYLVDELYKEQQSNKLAETFNKVRKLLLENKTEDAVNLYRNAYEEISISSPLTTIDILKDTSRYEAYAERTQDFNKFYISTGFKELDAVIGGWDRQEELATIVARPNVGKCLAKGTKVLLSDGTIKNIEDIKIGDKVQSLDSINTVLELHHGFDKGYKITPKLGEPFVVSANHILTVMERNHILNEDKGFQTTDGTFTLKDMYIEDYLKLSSGQKQMLMLFRPEVTYTKKELKIPPYILGSWLGDGTSCRVSITNADNEILDEWLQYASSNNLNAHLSPSTKRNKAKTYDITGKKGNKNHVLDNFRYYNLLNNKHIPLDYLTSSKEDRLELLAGILDTDGYLSDTKSGSFSLCLKNKLLIDQVAQLARGLGFRVGKISERKLNNPKRGLTSYFNFNISGDLTQIPNRLAHKKSIYNDPDRTLSLTGFTVEEIGEIEYFGFTCDGDHRFMLADNTLTHNSWFLLKCALAAAQQGLNVGIYSGEMSERKVGYRIDTLLQHISNGALIHGSPKIMNEYKKYIDSLPSKVPGTIRVLTPAMINGLASVTSLRAFIEKDNLDVLFIDQHSLLEDDRKAKNPVERASNISKDLKQLQVLKRIPIISVSQQNRSSTENGVGTEMVAQSDRISQDSTILIFIERKKDTDVLDLSLVKSRDSENGKKLSYKVDFNTGTFTYIPGENDVKTNTESYDNSRYQDDGDEVF